MNENPMQKTRGRYCQLSDVDYGWLFIWGNYGHDPVVNEWRKCNEVAGIKIWLPVKHEEVPANVLENALIFFGKAVRV